ncbi:thioredoxin [Sunxiuqinia sp. A32]|uniref:thioredoxin n=1 Tax=Sunxiuqinia sp. A32 TaxID=3461496 RepID=UPI0040454FDB
MNRRFRNIIKSEGLVLVDFYADWCVPCKQLEPIIKEVKENCNLRFRVVKVNVDKNPFIANQYNVKSIPTIILFKAGIPQWTGVGVYNVTELVNIIQNLT